MSNHSNTSDNSSLNQQNEDKKNCLNPQFNDSGFTPNGFNNHRKDLQQKKTIAHQQVLIKLLEKVELVDFAKVADLAEDEKLKANHYLVIPVEQVLSLARKNNWGLCRNHDFIYVYNGEYWSQLAKEELQDFLGEAAEKMGVDAYKARYYQYREHLYRQFLATANLLKPLPSDSTVLVNLKNGTFQITSERRFLRPHNREDFLTYQLPFSYDPEARAPQFQAFLWLLNPFGVNPLSLN